MGRRVTLSGRGYYAFEPVVVTWEFAKIARVKTDADGAFVVKVTVPSGRPGKVMIEAEGAEELRPGLDDLPGDAIAAVAGLTALTPAEPPKVSRVAGAPFGRASGANARRRRGPEMANTWFETVAEAQRRAKRRLPKSVYGALVAGSERGTTLEDNVAAFGELGFAPHVAGLAANRDLSVKVMGQGVSFPVLISPTGVQAVHPEGEVAVARAAAARGTAMGLSSFASMPVEEVVAANPQTFFQIYWIGSRDDMLARVERARAAGAVGLIATLDWSFSHGRDWGSPSIPETMDYKTALRFAPEVLAHPRWFWSFARTGKVPDLTAPNMVAKGKPASDLLRRLRRVDADAAAELGRRGLAARAVGRDVHAQGRHPRR